MNKLDEQYLAIAKDILDNGVEKETRSGKVISVFGRQIRHKMSDGFPVLTTKKMFIKGVIHELLWFIKGETNIKYLVENNVHIWDDDAYRWYCEIVDKHNMIISKTGEMRSVDSKTSVEIIYTTMSKCTKEVFLSRCLHENKFRYVQISNKPNEPLKFSFSLFKYGDLGPVYGKQWRNWNNSIDQLQNVINTLNINPNDRRLLVSAWNPSDISEMALPPCHYCYQFYTRPLTKNERFGLLRKKCQEEDIKYDDNTLEENNIPKYELSIMWNQRSVDFCLGEPLNITSYSLLLAMVAQCVNMTCGDVIGNLGDTHIYANHVNSLHEQLNNDPYKYDLPTLKLNPKINNINDFTFDDIKIEDYESYPKIHFPLSVGM